jgi:hypothetical protein
MEDYYYDGAERGLIAVFRNQLEVSELNYAMNNLGIDIEACHRPEAYRVLLEAVDARFRGCHLYKIGDGGNEALMGTALLTEEMIHFLPEATDECIRQQCGAYMLYGMRLEMLCEEEAESLKDLPCSAQAALKAAREKIEAFCDSLEKYRNDIVKAVRASMSDE